MPGGAKHLKQIFPQQIYNFIASNTLIRRGKKRCLGDLPFHFFILAEGRACKHEFLFEKEKKQLFKKIVSDFSRCLTRVLTY